MAERVVQHPAVAGDAGLQPVHELEQTVEDRLPEHREMLVMMVERADAPARHDAQEHPRQENHRRVDESVHGDVAREEQRNEGDGQTVFGVAE